MTRTRAPRRMTRAVLHGGTLVGGTCLAVGMALEMLGRPGTAGSLLDSGAIASGVVHLDPWAWSALGVWVVIATPIAALVTTALEFRAIGDRRAALATLTVVMLLGLSLLVGLARGG